MLGMRDSLGQQNAHVLVVQGVDDVPALALANDQAEMAKHPKLLGDGRLLHLNVLRQLANGARTSTQPAQDPHAARCRQCSHRLGDHARGVAVQIRQIRVMTMTHARIIA